MKMKDSLSQKIKKNVKKDQKMKKIPNKEQQGHQKRTKTTKSTLQDRLGGALWTPKCVCPTPTRRQGT